MSTTEPYFPTGRCRSCQAVVIWAETAKHKRMPVDAAPRADGTIWLVPRVGTPLAVFAPINGAAPEQYVSHFATCPQANQHRRSVT